MLAVQVAMQIWLLPLNGETVGRRRVLALACTYTNACVHAVTRINETTMTIASGC